MRLPYEEIIYALQLRGGRAGSNVHNLLAQIEKNGWAQVERLPSEEHALAKGALIFACAAAEGAADVDKIARDFIAATADVASVRGEPMELFIRNYYHG